MKLGYRVVQREHDYEGLGALMKCLTVELKQTPLQIQPELVKNIRNGWYYLIGLSGNQPIGYLSFSPTMSRNIVLHDLWVKPEHRRKGFGQSLVKKLAALARQREYDQINAYPTSKQRKFFEALQRKMPRFGFEFVEGSSKMQIRLPQRRGKR